jgi:hypothetical protein
MKKLLICLLIIASFSASGQVQADTAKRRSQNAMTGLSNKVPGLLVTLDTTYNPTYKNVSRKLDCSKVKALFILNNRKLPCDSLQFISPEGIEDIQVLDSASATKLYGNPAGTYGALIITTKSYETIKRKNRKQDMEKIKEP